MAPDEKNADQAFDVANGDLIRWSRFWPKLASAFDMKMGSVRPLRLADVMADMEDVWQTIVERYGLINRPLAAAWDYSDGTLARYWDEIMSLNKARAFGFSDFADSEAVFFRICSAIARPSFFPESEQVGKRGRAIWACLGVAQVSDFGDLVRSPGGENSSLLKGQKNISWARKRGGLLMSWRPLERGGARRRQCRAASRHQHYVNFASN